MSTNILCENKIETECNGIKCVCGEGTVAKIVVEEVEVGGKRLQRPLCLCEPEVV